MFWNVGLLAADEGVAIIALVCNCIFLIFALAATIGTIAGLWKIFEKAGKPGWGAIVPIYNIYLLTEIAGKDIMWFILALIPCVQFVALIVIWMDVAKAFGKDATYGLGLAFFTFVFAPMLGFSDARYLGPQKPVM